VKYKTIEYDNQNNKLILFDQRKLPLEIKYFTAKDYNEVAFAISDMVVRGAPAIGATGAYGFVIASQEFRNLSKNEFLSKMKEASNKLSKARPTAVNLTWAIKRMNKVLNNNKDKPINEIISILQKEANKIYDEDIETNKQMAKHGNKIVPEGANIIHHCNTGALATVDYGTALGVIREAHYSNKNIHVYVDETRPRLQGARLTGFELIEENIPATLIIDSAAPTLMKQGKIDLVLVGADRIASNGDIANKIGTFMLSLAANKYDVPMYVVAPVSTIDFDIESGDQIEIEERSKDEIINVQGTQIAPKEIEAYNPAFDITPAENLTGIITEKGILKAPFKESIKNLL